MIPNRVTALSATLVFPAGLAPGSGRERNHALIARDGRGRPVLRGTALAGVLRHACADGDDALMSRYFGTVHEGGGSRSRLLVPDLVLETAAGGVLDRHHIRRNRHSGAAAGQALFSVEACPPGTCAELVLWLESDSEHAEDDDEAFLARLARVLGSGVIVGGSGSRGIGRGELEGGLRRRTFDLTDLEQYAEYLEAHLAWRRDGTQPGGEAVSSEPGKDRLDITLKLTIPRGQDLLIADGRGVEYDLEPQEILAADGCAYWRLPGATLRGLFRDWMLRLAARDGVETLFDSGVDWDVGVTGHEHGKGGAESKDQLECPIAMLFGTTHHRGRIHVSDALAPAKDFPRQVRMHVAVDAITGGARDGALFDDVVIVSPPDWQEMFEVKIRIEDPEKREVVWLVQTIKALDMGLLRVGSSKAAGCLCMAGRPVASGCFHELVEALTPERREAS